MWFIFNYVCCKNNCCDVFFFSFEINENACLTAIFGETVVGHFVSIYILYTRVTLDCHDAFVGSVIQSEMFCSCDWENPSHLGSYFSALTRAITPGGVGGWADNRNFSAGRWKWWNVKALIWPPNPTLVHLNSNSKYLGRQCLMTVPWLILHQIEKIVSRP